MHFPSSLIGGHHSSILFEFENFLAAAVIEIIIHQMNIFLVLIKFQSSNKLPQHHTQNKLTRFDNLLSYLTPYKILSGWWIIRRKLRLEYLTEMKITLIQEQARQFSQNNLHICHHVFRHVLPTRHMFQALQQFATQVNSRLSRLSETNSIEVFKFSRLKSLFYS